MARIRTIKPSFFASEAVSELPLRARLTWIGLWTHCDDQGRCRDNPRLIKAAVWPLDDVTLRDIDDDLDVLARQGRILRYQVESRCYLQITNWAEHQRISRPSSSELPGPPAHGGLTEGSVRAHGRLSEGSRQEGKGREVEGDARVRAREPPRRPRCEQHKHLSDDDTGPNCVRCRDARLAAEQQDRDQRATTSSATRACNLCDAEGWRYEPDTRIPLTPYQRCDHQRSGT